MKKFNSFKSIKSLLFLSFISCNYIIGQTPGGIAGSTLWLKSDQATGTTVNGAANGTWNSIIAAPVVNLVQLTNANRPIYRNGAGTTATNRFNYNPFLEFDGINDNMRHNASIDLGDATTGMTIYQITGHNSGIVAFQWSGPNGRVKMKSDGIYALTNSLSWGINNQFSSPTTFQGYLASLRGTNIGTTGRLNGLLLPPGSNNIPDIGTNITVGSNIVNTEFMSGGCSEFIIFPSILSAADNLKVESYLGIKYGITLGTPVFPSNYTLSNATISWTGTAAYQNNIIGIGRDDNTLLLQKQSHNYDDTVRIYKGTLASTNIGNASAFALNNSIVIAGENTGRMCATAASNAEIPTGLLNCTMYSRIEREWRITKTNYDETFNMDFKLASCANLGSVNIADLRLLVDNDGDFSNGGTQCYYNGDGTGIAISYTNPLITITGFSNTHIPNNQTKFITIASVNVLTPLPIELINFDAKLNSINTVDLNWNTNSEKDNAYFTIEKSIDGLNWDYFSTVEGEGTTNTPHSYYLEDPKPKFGYNYYKLKQTDINGI
ncbi:MAG: hypothetical protein ACOVOV_13920, partial [Dolichospermum sp.]